MFRLIAVLGAVLTFAVVPASGLGRSASTLCVGGKPGCYATVQAAVDAAHDGDTIAVAAGTFAGGITITKSITLSGAGAKSTVLKGGGPVVTIGSWLAPSPPTVTLSDLTIANGVSTSSPQSQDWVGADNVIATGGGVEIFPSDNYGAGATVSIRDSVISGNRVGPTTTLPIGPACPSGRCSFAWAKGGGIDNWGRLTLTNTVVSGNTAAGLASDADGGGIYVWWTGTLSLHHSAIDGNKAVAVVPNGRYAEGGGIFTDPGTQLTIDGGELNENVASLTSNLPYELPGGDTIDMNANGGAVHAGDGTSVAIDGVALRNNTVSVSDANGRPYAFDAALHPGSGPLAIRDSVIDGNSVVADVQSTDGVGPSGSAIDINGAATVADTRISRTTTVVTSHGGTAAGSGAVYAGDDESDAIVISNTQISGNTVTATSYGGDAEIIGAGLTNDGLLVLRNDLVAGNVGTANGSSGFARGGGIWNGHLFNGGAIQLTLDGTAVLRNTLAGGVGVQLQGGGLYTDLPVTTTNTQIARNTPDDCAGC
jgi:hypothetical protein